MPQAQDGIYTYNSRLHLDPDDPTHKKIIIMPSVLSRGKAVWDWARHAVEPSVEQRTVPLALRVLGDTSNFPKPDLHATHYSTDGKIVGGEDVVLYEAQLTPPILAVDPEEAEWLPTTSDSAGKEAAIQHWRHAVISPIANVWKFVFANETIKRTAPKMYVLAGGSRHVVEVVTPFSEVTQTTLNETTAELGEEPENMLHATKVTYSSGMSFGYSGGMGRASTGMTETPIDISGRTNPIPGTRALTEKMKQTSGSPITTEHIIAVGAADGVDHISIDNSLQYVRDVYWRCGEATAIFSKYDVYGDSFTGDKYGVDSIRLLRKDMHYHLDGTPALLLDAGWHKIKAIEGTTTGRMDGKLYTDISTTHFDNFQWSNSVSEGHGHRFITRANSPVGITGDELFAWFQQNDVLMTEVATWAEEFGPIPGHTDEETVKDEPPSNTAEYSLKSRYVIDYDHRGQFYVAIRVEVECKDGAWKHAPEVYLGYMEVDKIPTYTVKIYFESNWNGVTAEKLLVTETCDRPMFEAQTLIKTNPYYWPAPIELERPVYVRMPPVIRPDENVILQLKNMSLHQGVNDCMAMSDVRDDLPPNTVSDSIVEYSYIKDGKEISHRKRAKGMLYARTFSLSEFDESLWLLRHTRCDAVEGGFSPPLEFPPRPAWFYMPVIKAALSKKFHIELRDGVIKQWSDDVPGKEDPRTGARKKAPADPTKRDIKLYLV